MSTAKEAALEAQKKARMEADLAKQQLRSVIGGAQDFTTQGCKCTAEYEYNGALQKGCIRAGGNMMAGGKVWCVTVGMCGSSLGDGRFFDTCPIATKRG